MSKRGLRTCVLAVLLVSILCSVYSGPVHAQRGRFIEDLFRSIAEAQLEREQRKRLEAEQAARENPPPIHDESIPPQSITPRVDDDRGIGPFPGGRITVRSREAAQFVNDLIAFDASLGKLIEEMRFAGAQNVAVRSLLPEAFEVAAQTRALLGLCNGLGQLTEIRQPFAALDASWRQLSFELRSLGELSDSCRASILQCDQALRQLSRQIGLQPQVDRHQLHDLMIVAATYMQALIDDLQISRVPARERQELIHDCRILRQRLLSEADAVGEVPYEEITTRFNDFASRWETFAAQLHTYDDPHLSLRLDRIRQCGDQTYALLWIPPPYNARTLTAAAQRLEKNCADVLDQLTIRSMLGLPTQQRIQILNAGNRLYEASRAFVQATTEGASRDRMQRQFAEIDALWSSLSPVLHQLPNINHGTLTSIDRQCEHLRRALGLSPAREQTVDYDELIPLAASVEGGAEYLLADLQRYQRYLQPDEYRQSLIEGGQEFYQHAKTLHAQLSRRADFQTLQREARSMLNGWRQLTDELSHIDGHGLSSQRTRFLRRAHDALLPEVARLGAALGIE